MSERHDFRLNGIKEAYHQIVVPAKIDEAIRQGVNMGKAHRGRRRVYRSAAAAVALLVITLIVSIRFSPSIAAYVGKLQIVEFLAQMRDRDSGLETAVENDYMQHIGKSVKHGGITFTLNDIIVDETRMIGFYTLTDHVGYKQINNVRADWVDAATGKIIANGGRGEIAPPWEKKGDQLNGNVEIFFREGTEIPEKMTLNIQMDVQRQEDAILRPLNQKWEFSFKIDKQKFSAHKQVVDINETVSLDGQKVTFLKAIMLPTTTRLDFTIDPNNTKQIFSIEDLHLVDETGREWKQLDHFGYLFHKSYVDPSRGYGANNWSYEAYEKSLNSPPEIISIYFESSYLTHTQSLEIAGSSIRALDKDKLDILVDLDGQKLLKAPDDRLKLKSAKLYPELLEIVLQMPKSKQLGRPDPSFDGYRMERVFSAKEYGLKLSSEGGGCGSTYPDVSESTDLCFKTKFKDIDLRQYLDNPLRFKIYDYGYDKLHQPFRVMIK